MGLINVDKFKFFSQVVLPAVYDESLSYYEVLNKVRYKLNEVVDSTNAQNTVIRDFVNEINNAVDDFIHDMVSDYDSTKSYVKGNYCWYENDVYKCKGNTTGAFDSDMWDEVVFADAVGEDVRLYVEKVDNLISQVAPAYRNYFTYEVGEMCVYEDVVYVCRTRVNPPEPFDSEKWRTAIITTELKNRVDTYWQEFINDYYETLNIVQTTGDSTTHIMSQNATTTELSKRLAITRDKYTVPSSGVSIDTLLNEGVYVITADASSITDVPFEGSGIVAVISSNTAVRKLQFAISNVTGDVYYRYYNGTQWLKWFHIFNQDVLTDSLNQSTGDSTTSAMSQNSVTNELLKRMPITRDKYIVPASGVSINALLSEGVYVITGDSSSITNVPFDGSGIVAVISSNTSVRKLQFTISNVTGDVYYRYYNGTQWLKWFHVINEDILKNTLKESTFVDSPTLLTELSSTTEINNVTTRSTYLVAKSISSVPYSSQGGILHCKTVYNVTTQIFTTPTNVSYKRERIDNVWQPWIPINYKSVPRLMVTFVDDDGDTGFLNNMMPIIASTNSPISCPITTTRVGTSGFMTWEQIKSCYENGADVANHTYNHVPQVDDMTQANQYTQKELELQYIKAKNNIVSHGLGTGDILICNNVSAEQERVREAARNTLKGCFRSYGGNPVTALSDRYYLPRFAVDASGTGNQELSQAHLKEVLDVHAGRLTGWLVFCFHTTDGAWTATHTAAIEYAINYCQTLGLPVVTLETGFNEYFR